MNPQSLTTQYLPIACYYHEVFTKELLINGKIPESVHDDYNHVYYLVSSKDDLPFLFSLKQVKVTSESKKKAHDQKLAIGKRSTSLRNIHPQIF